MIDCLGKFSVLNTRASAHLVALDPDSLMLRYLTVNPCCIIV